MEAPPNEYMVGIAGDKIVIMMQPRAPMTRKQALGLAAWLVAIADPTVDDFSNMLAAVLDS